MAISRFNHVSLLAQILLLFYLTLFAPSWAWAGNPSSEGSALFEVHCAGCHPQGGNIIRRGKTLKQKALQANHVDTPETIAALIANGQGNMTAFRDRLTVEQIAGITEYVMAQANSGWKG